MRSLFGILPLVVLGVSVFSEVSGASVCQHELLKVGLGKVIGSVSEDVLAGGSFKITKFAKSSEPSQDFILTVEAELPGQAPAFEYVVGLKIKNLSTCQIVATLPY